jgi:hypothetical protein
MDRRRAKQRRSAEVRIEFAMLNSQCKTAREWERAPTQGTLVFVRALATVTSTTKPHLHAYIGHANGDAY